MMPALPNDVSSPAPRRSIRTVSRPRICSCKAVATPTMPAPSTATSVFIMGKPLQCARQLGASSGRRPGPDVGRVNVSVETSCARLKIAPSILASDFSRLGEEIRAICDAGADCRACRRDGRAFRPQHHHRPRCGEGAAPAHRQGVRRASDDRALRSLSGGVRQGRRRTSSPSTPRPGRTCTARCRRIRALGKKAGVSLNPATPESVLEYVLDEVDLILVMTVNPGFGGQKIHRLGAGEDPPPQAR